MWLAYIHLQGRTKDFLIIFIWMTDDRTDQNSEEIFSLCSLKELHLEKVFLGLVQWYSQLILQTMILLSVSVCALSAPLRTQLSAYYMRSPWHESPMWEIRKRLLAPGCRSARLWPCGHLGGEQMDGSIPPFLSVKYPLRCFLPFHNSH